jgi:tetratricopeptide (TPR) repeat protein
MHPTGAIVERVIGLVIFLAIAVWLLIRALKRSEDPVLLIVKWILTVLIIGCIVWKAVPMADPNTQGVGAFAGVALAAFCGLALYAVWRHNIASIVSKPFESLYDGGDREIEPSPVYSVARAKRNRGRYDEAIGEIRKQLDTFPQDFEGYFMLAEIEAENLNDLRSAEITIQRLCNQPGRAPRHIVLALNTLADWHLKFAQDRDAARQDLERIIALFPDSEMSALAAQRIAHLADTAFLLESHDRKRIAVPHGVENMGLLAGAQQPNAPQADPAKMAAEYVKHLEDHPLDTEAREKLALLYADHYQRLDLAADQLEQLIGHPHQPASRVTHWLNALADLQLRHSADYETVRRTVQRIIDLYPGAPAAQTARNRLDHLTLEFKGKEKSQTVKLGSYEQDIGLKRKG